jgi:phenylacetate-CoA ligase
MINYAYTYVPLYRRIYQKAGVHPNKIKALGDCRQVPIVSKDDFIKENPKNILPSRLKEKEAIKTSTSGTTGTPVSIYVTISDIISGLFGYIRALKEHGVNWRRDKIALLLDLRGDSVEHRYLFDGVFPALKPMVSFDNMHIYNLQIPPEKLIVELDKFQPDYIWGYMGMLSHLAVLKDTGTGDNINPRAISITGAPLDKYMRKFVEETFHTDVFESYGSTEAGPIAFECPRKKFHIHSDLVYPGVLKYRNLQSINTGRLIITKLYGEGTPIINYVGVNDIVAFSNDTCDCGLQGELLEKIYGRENLSLVFPKGYVMMPSSITEIFSKVLYEYKSRMIKQTQISQKKRNEIKIRMVIDHKLENGISTRKLFSIIKEGFYEKIVPELDVSIDLKEVKNIQGDKFIISMVDKNEFNPKFIL